MIMTWHEGIRLFFSLHNNRNGDPYMYIAHSTENWTGIRIGFIDIATANASEAICELPTLLELSRQIRKKKRNGLTVSTLPCICRFPYTRTSRLYHSNFKYYCVLWHTIYIYNAHAKLSRWSGFVWYTGREKNVCTVRAQHIAIFIHSYSCWYSVVADVTSIHLNKKEELEQRKKQREICLSAIWPKTVSV